MYLYSRTHKHCDDVLHLFCVENLNLKYMTKVRYACIKTEQNYYHNFLIQSVKNLRDLSLFGDISIYSTLLKKSSYQLNRNPEMLYNLFDTPEDKQAVAVALRDFKGMRYLNVDPTKLIQESFWKYKEQIYYSIELNDITTFKSILKTQIEFEDLDLYLKLAYKYESLEIAAFLINYGAKFNTKYLLLSWMQRPFLDYENHANLLLFEQDIDQKTYDGLQNLLQATHCKNTLYKENNSNYYELKTLIHTNSETLDILSIDYNVVTKSLFSIFIASNFPHFVIPSIGYLKPLFLPRNLYYKVYLANPENTNFKYQFIHELTHAFLYLIFDNHGLQNRM